MKLRDPQLLVRLRSGLPDEKGRAGRHLSQRQAALHFGIHFSHYAHIESGRKQPSFEVGRRMAEFYGVSMTALFDEIPLEFGEAS